MTESLKSSVGFSGIWWWGCRLQPAEHPSSHQIECLASLAFKKKKTTSFSLHFKTQILIYPEKTLFEAAQRHDWLIRLQVWLRCSRRLAFGARRGEIWRFFFLCRLEETYTYYLCWEEVACSGATSVETVANLNRAASVQGHDSPIC